MRRVYVALRKSRNSDTRMKRSMAPVEQGHVLPVRIDDELRLGELVLAAPCDEAHGAMGEGVAHPLRVTAVGQRDAEAVLGAQAH